MMRRKLEGTLVIQGPTRRTYGDGSALGPIVERAGECYMYAFMVVAMWEKTPTDRAFLEQLAAKTGHRSIVLVHGFPRRTARETDLGLEDGIPLDCRFGHAWVELRGSPYFEDVVYDAVTAAAMDADIYYETGKIRADHCFAYDMGQALAHAVEIGSAGPWEDYAGDERAHFTDDDGKLLSDVGATHELS